MEVCTPLPPGPPRRLQSGHSVTPFEGAARKRYYAQWRGFQGGPVRIQPGGLVMPEPFSTLHDTIWNFKFRSDDVVVMTYPKCGTTWMQELVWTIKQNPNVDKESALAPINLRSPHLEFDSFNSTDKESLPDAKESVFVRLLSTLVSLILHFFASAVLLQMYILRYCPRLTDHQLRLAIRFCPSVLNVSMDVMMKKYPGRLHLMIDHVIMRLFKSSNPIPGLMLKLCEHMTGPRVIKTHLPFSLLPRNVLEKSKVIYVMRNPKDMLVSYYHHCRLLKIHGYAGTFEDFVQTFLDGDLLYGNYYVNLKEAFAHMENPNLLMVQYEDLKAAPVDEIRRINNFLGSNLTEEQIKKVAHYTSFSEMKKRDNVAGPSIETGGGLFDSKIAKVEGGFFRKGEAGAWKDELSPELSSRLDRWINDNFAPYGIGFRFTE